MIKEIVVICSLCALLALSGCSQNKNEEPKQRVRIGTYDSRAIALAYWRTDDRLDRYHVPLVEQAKQAKAAGDQQRAKELDEELWAHQKLLHRQVFSTEPVDEILDHIKDRLPEITARTGVTEIISKWDKKRLVQYRSAKLVDVTDQLVDVFKPDDKTLAMIKELPKHKPLTKKQAEHHH
ncbi:MAG: hypothetical protein ACYSWP_04680 [Planctomycetota bacterium]|jgi:hypothetical protein